MSPTHGEERKVESKTLKIRLAPDVLPKKISSQGHRQEGDSLFPAPPPRPAWHLRGVHGEMKKVEVQPETRAGQFPLVWVPCEGTVQAFVLVLMKVKQTPTNKSGIAPSDTRESNDAKESKMPKGKKEEYKACLPHPSSFWIDLPQAPVSSHL